MPLSFIIGFYVAMPLHEFLHAISYPKGAMIQATENGLVWYEQIAALQAELSKERQHSREQVERIAVLADQAQRLQLAQMQQQPEPPRSWWSRFWSK